MGTAHGYSRREQRELAFPANEVLRLASVAGARSSLSSIQEARWGIRIAQLKKCAWPGMRDLGPQA
eukprot:14182820-Alexandrium_andersonii.AAC.1